MNLTSQKPVFILGVGAQKSATSWVYAYITQNTSIVNFGQHKEYHVWDAVFNPYGLFEPLKFSKESIDPKDLYKFHMQTVSGWYESYFKNLIRNGIRITGDMSPTYCALKAEHFKHVKDILEAAEFDVKVIFLMRDPVERCWSAARMLSAINKNPDPVAEFSKAYKDPYFAIRTHYEKTLDAIQSVFIPSSIFVGIYEELFTNDNIKKLSDFVGIDYNPAFKKRKANPTAYTELPESLQKDCYNYYKNTYLEIYNRYPQTKTLWKNYDNT